MTTIDIQTSRLTVSPDMARWLSVLTKTVGVPFQLCQCGPTSEAARLAMESAQREGSGVWQQDRHTASVWVSLPTHSRRPQLASATVSTSETPLLRRLAASARQLIEHEQTIRDQTADGDSFVESLSYSLEEQTWLRSLNGHLSLCTIRRKLEDVSQAILPSLRSLIRAADVKIILNPRSAAKGVLSGSLAEAEVITCADGEDRVSDATWCRWLEQLPLDIPQQPIVQNGPSVPALLQPHQVSALCAMPIVRDDHIYGWLVAVKHPLAAHEVPKSIEQLEFGTVEAGLMEAAASMLATHGSNVELLEDRENLTIGVIRAMGHAIDARDPYTRGHSERVGRYGQMLAKSMQLPFEECHRIYLSGLLHDVGKIGIPDVVLAKPGRLTDDEFAIVKQHPEIGAKILRNLPQLANLLPGVLHHHESIDGSGYPHGLKGTEIPLMGRVLAVADAYDAMTSNRPYRAGMPRLRAAEILTTNAGIQWDAELVRAFLTIPEQQLMLDAIESDQGWKTDEDALRQGSAALYDHRQPAHIKPASVDDALPQKLREVPC